MTRPEPILLVNDSWGIYVPQRFAQWLDTASCTTTGYSAEDRVILLKGPDHEHYWEAWDTVLQSAKITETATGNRYDLSQDGDLWLIPEGMEWVDGIRGFAWPE